MAPEAGVWLLVGGQTSPDPHVEEAVHHRGQGYNSKPENPDLRPNSAPVHLPAPSGVSKLQPTDQIQPPPVLVNKVLLVQSRPLVDVSSVAAATRAELSRCNRDQMAHKPENIYYLALYRQSVDPCAT